MNTIKLRNNLTKKLALLSDEQLKLVSDFLEQFDLQLNSIETEENQLQLIKKWEYLVNNNLEEDKSDPLSNNEIKMICQILIRDNKTRHLGLAKGEFTIPDDFNEPLPDEIIDLTKSLEKI
jgi:hypothetical protein